MFKPIFSFIVITLSVSFAFLYIMPEYDRTKERISDLANLDKISKDSRKIEKQISETEATLNSVDADDRARFAVFLPEAPDPIRLANNLQRIGLTNGIVLQDIKTEEAAAGAQKSAKPNGSGALQSVANIFSLGGTGEGAKDGSIAGEKKYATTKTSFSFAATHEAFSKFLFDTERSLGLINITALSFVPVPVMSDTKKSKQTAPPLYQYAVTVETYSLK